jgi:hypothetical protein
MQNLQVSGGFHFVYQNSSFSILYSQSVSQLVVSPVQSVYALGASTSNNRIMAFSELFTQKECDSQRDIPSLFNFGMDDNDSYLSLV